MDGCSLLPLFVGASLQLTLLFANTSFPHITRAVSQKDAWIFIFEQFLRLLRCDENSVGQVELEQSEKRCSSAYKDSTIIRALEATAAYNTHVKSLKNKFYLNLGAYD